MDFSIFSQQVAITVQLVVKAAKASLKGPFANSLATNVGAIETVRSQNITEIGVNIADYRNAWPWECVQIVSYLELVLFSFN